MHKRIVMFTGLIQQLGKIAQTRPVGDGMRLTVEAENLTEQVKIGDSVAVNGLCLTAVRITGSQIEFDVSGESVKSSNIADLRAGAAVNIELAMRPTDRFGGHFVQGHIDGTAAITDISQSGRFWKFRYNAPPELLDMMIVKGSVAVDGISLTVAELDDDSFSIAVIPETFNATNLKHARIGDKANIETDLIIKAVSKRLDAIGREGQKPAGLSIEKLHEMGF